MAPDILLADYSARNRLLFQCNWRPLSVKYSSNDYIIIEAQWLNYIQLTYDCMVISVLNKTLDNALFPE